MTVTRWSMTLMGCGLSVLWFLYCIEAVRSAWGLVSMGLLLVMSFRVLVDTVDLCCGQWLRGQGQAPAAAVPLRVRRIILEEVTVMGEAEGPFPRGGGGRGALRRETASPTLAQPVAPRRTRHSTSEASTYGR